MDFTGNKAIYLQIAEHVVEKILLEFWVVEEKIPSVRELAVQLEVNPNTVMRTYDFLQQMGVIYNKRGIGFFVTSDSLKYIKKYKRTTFIGEDLPQVFKNIYLLDIGLDELKDRYQAFVEQTFKTSQNENE